MVQYVMANGATGIYDPAVGAGAFFHAAKRYATREARSVALSGMEIDGEALLQAALSGLAKEDLKEVHEGDFVRSAPTERFPAIVANPPYIRHHRISKETKADLKGLSLRLIGKALDGRTGLHVFFLLRALEILDDHGRLAFILPADVFEGIFAKKLWQWITAHFCLDAVVTFTPEASPFPGVDTNPIIILIRRECQQDAYVWARCKHADGGQLQGWIAAGMGECNQPHLTAEHRKIEEGIRTGLSREPGGDLGAGPTLGDFAYVQRGIATGSNAFFFLTRSRAEELGISDEFLVGAVGRTRDVCGETITSETLDNLDRKGRPTRLFCLDGRPLEEFPAAIRAYLVQGEAAGLSTRPLISTRRPWYKMEQRTPPAIFFAYLGRRHVRFLRNLAGIVPLTGFLCVYPRRKEGDFVEKLWQVLNHPQTIENLKYVSKSYGDGALKTEPRALERLVLPVEVVNESGLILPTSGVQMTLVA